MPCLCGAVDCPSCGGPTWPGQEDVLVVDPVQAFHDHLDECRQCDETPFELCAEGNGLLMAVADVARIYKGIQ